MTMHWRGVRPVVHFALVATTSRLLVAGVDVSATGANTTVEEWALLASVGASFFGEMVPLAVMVPAVVVTVIASFAIAALTLMVVRQRRCGTQVESASTAAA